MADALGLLSTDTLSAIDRLAVSLDEGRRAQVESMMTYLAELDRLTVEARRVLDGQPAAVDRVRKRLGWVIAEPAKARAYPMSAELPAVNTWAVQDLFCGVIWAASGWSIAANAMADVASRMAAPFAALGAFAIGSDTTPSERVLDAILRDAEVAAGLIRLGYDGPGDGGFDDGPLVPHLPGGVLPLPGPSDDDLGALDLHPINMDYLDPMVCLFRAMEIVHQKANASDRYSVTSIQPDPLCIARNGKTTVTIRGRGFGSVPGTILFASSSGPLETIEVSSTSWTDTQIVCEVGDQFHDEVRTTVVSGAVRIRILVDTVYACGREIPVYMLADETVNVDSAPRVWSLEVNDLEPPGFIAPDASATISWETTSSPTTRVVVGIERVTTDRSTSLSPPAVVFDALGGGKGTVKVSIPPLPYPQLLRVRVTTTSSCPSRTHSVSKDWMLAPPMHIRVLAMEVTQGYQYLKGGLNLASVEPQAPPGQRVTLVSHKDTLVRVAVGYEDDGMLWETRPVVTGTLSVDDKQLYPIGSGQTRATDSIARRPISTTLNFRIPAAWCAGSIMLHARVVATDAAGRRIHAGRQETWQWTNTLDLCIRWVRIDSTRPTPTHPALHDHAYLDAIVRAFDHLPSAPVNIARCVMPTMGTSKDPGERGMEWAGGAGDLEGRADMWWNLDNAHDAAGRTGEIWLGLYSINTGGKSCRNDRTAVSSTNPITIAHEVGHLRDLGHKPGSCAGGQEPDDLDDTNDPTPFAKQVALNMHPDDRYLATIDPQPGRTLGDLMSYACDRATTPETWEAIRATL